jgi:hypothetical protein
VPAAAPALVVVDVAPDEPELDAAALRPAIASELGAEAIAPDDPRAAQASGRLRISIDRSPRALVVTYRGQSEPLQRRIELPPDRPSIERAAVLLAGNLARDEADELAAELRRGKQDAPSPSSNPSSSPSAPSASSAPAKPDEKLADTEDDEDERDAQRLGAALAYYQQQNAARATTSSILMGLGYGALGVSLGVEAYGLLSSQHRPWAPDASLYVIQAADALFVGSALARPGNFDWIQATYDWQRRWGTPWAARRETEQAWLRVARNEHWNRRFIGWLTTAIGVIGTGLCTAFLVSEAEQPPSRSDLGPMVGFDAIAVADTVMGLYLVTTDGPVESALHEYERSVGRRVRAEDATGTVQPFFAPVRSGGVVGLGGRF